MVMFLKEKNAKKIFKKYPNGVTAYTYVKSRKPAMDVKVDFDYFYHKDLLPTPDEINAVVSGDMTAKKVIKKMKKTLTKSFGNSAREMNMCISVCSLINMLMDEDMKNPRVFVFIAEEEEGDTARRTRIANKFVRKWLEEMFGVFDIPVVGDKEFKKNKEYDGKTLEQMFKKAKKKKIRTMIRELDSNCMTAAANVIQRCMNIAYRPELIYQSLDMMISHRGSSALTGIGKKKRAVFVEQIFAKIDRSSHEQYDRLRDDVSKKEREKIEKTIKKYKKAEKKADKDIFEYYKLFQKVFEEIARANRDKAAKDPNARMIKTPKIPVYKKKMKDKKAIKVMDFYKKKNHMYLMAALVAHICALRVGAEFGSPEHIKAVTEVLSLEDKLLANQFKATVKAFAEAANKMQSQK